MRAVECGSAAVYVSNHGGRWMDSRVPTLWALPEVASAVGGRVEVCVRLCLCVSVFIWDTRHVFYLPVVSPIESKSFRGFLSNFFG